MYIDYQKVTDTDIFSIFSVLPQIYQELGEMSYKDLKSMSWSGRDKSQTQGRTVTSWTRLLGQLCRVPNSLTLTLAAGRKGCFVVKFSNDGR